MLLKFNLILIIGKMTIHRTLHSQDLCDAYFGIEGCKIVLKEKIIEFTEIVPFFTINASVKKYKLSSDIILQPSKVSVAEGGETIYRIVGNGTNTVSFKGCKLFGGSVFNRLDLRDDFVNIIAFKRIGGVTYYSIVDQYYDTELPISVLSATLPLDNSELIVKFSQPCWADKDQTLPVQAGDFSLEFQRNGGDVTGVTISGLLSETENALVGGEQTIKFQLNKSQQATGDETVNLKILANSVYNSTGIVTPEGIGTGAVALNDETIPEITELNPKMYIAFDNADNVTLDGTNITQANDLSGNGNHGTSPDGFRPTFDAANNRAVMNGGKYLDFGDNLKFQSQTIFTVMEITSLSGTLRLLGCNTTGGRAADNAYMESSGTTLHFAGGNAAAYAFDLTHSFSQTGQKVLIVGIYDAVSRTAKLRIDGQQIEIDTAAATSLNVPDAAFEWISGAYNYVDGTSVLADAHDPYYQYETGVFDRALSDADLSSLETNLKNKYSI